MRALCLMLLFVLGCPKNQEPEQPRYDFNESDFPEDDELDDLPEADTGLNNDDGNTL